MNPPAISGATYIAVPQPSTNPEASEPSIADSPLPLLGGPLFRLVAFLLPSTPHMTANPKSHNFTCPVVDKRTFSGFKSLKIQLKMKPMLFGKVIYL
jgi:hypothetical protein